MSPGRWNVRVPGPARRAWVLVWFAALGVPDLALAQVSTPAQKPAPPASGLKVGTIDLSVLWRNRVERWSWFEAAPATDTYTYMNSLVRVAIGQSRPRVDWRVELAQPAYLGVPADAVAPPPQGALGLGPAYFGANDQRTKRATAFPRQVYLTLKQPGRSSLRVGRFEFFDGTEVSHPHAAVSGLVQSRVAHRLISNEAFPAAQRSFDGAWFTWTAGAQSVTGFAAKPTAGGVHLEGWKELDIQVYYGAFNRLVQRPRGGGSLRAFVVGYVDRRDALKPDNRPQPIRAVDRESIALTTFGANYVCVYQTDRAGTFDVIAWAAAQTGSWGALSHRAVSAFGEAGWQPVESKLRPWLRAGFRHSSGDDDPTDDRNGTFYQVFGATRQYARMPFYNLMNLNDLYALIAVRPKASVAIRSEIHQLRLADGADLWYGGGGPGQDDAFGYAGRPAQGRDGLAAFWDVSVDTQLIPHLGVNLYYGRASGGGVVEGIYPAGDTGHFGYVETVVRY